MADNFDFTEGTGKTGAADDIGGVLYPRVKLIDGTADSATVIAVDVGAKVNALRIAPANDITDATYIGDIKFGEGLPANSGVDIGDVDITSIVPGVAATNLGKAEDAGHSTGDVGVMALTVRQDAAAALGGTDADYQPLITDASGRLHIAPLVAGSAAIGKLAANTGVDIGDVDVTSIVPGTAATNLGKAEDAVHASGDVGVAVMTVRANAATSLSGADNDYQPLITDTNGRLYVIEANSATMDADTGAIKLAAEIMDDWDAVHDSAASTDGPQIMAAYDSTKPTAVADGDAVRLLADAYGRLLTGLEPEWFNAVYDSADATAEGKTVKAATASKKIYILSCLLSSDVETWAKLQDEDSNALTGKLWLKAGGGTMATWPPESPLVLNVANKALEVITEVAGDVSVTVTGYLAP